MNKKKVLFFLYNPVYARNYISTGVLNGLEEEYSFSYLVPYNMTNLDFFSEKESVYTYNPAFTMRREHFLLFNLLMWRYKSKSTSFEYRIKRLMGAKAVFSKDDDFVRRAMKTAVSKCRRLLSRISYMFFSNPLVFPLSFAFLKRKIRVNETIKHKIEAVKPDLVIAPSSAYDPDNNDMLAVCKELGIKTLYLVDNWDNLSSKSVLWIKPDYIGVWGEQSQKHASQIQEIDLKYITKLGTPRFEQYFKLRDTDLPAPFDFKYILYVGASLACDEASSLERVDRIIERNRQVLGNVKILYRPHPWRQGYDSILDKSLKNIVIDPQVREAYPNAIGKKIYIQPDLNYYPALLKNSEYVMGGLTSMLIESLIFRKRFIALVHDIPNLTSNQKNALKYFVHFEGLQQINALHFCDDLVYLENVMLDVWTQKNNIDNDEVDSQRRYYCYDDDTSYPERLKALVASII